MTRVYLFNGIPTGLIVELLERGLEIEFRKVDKEWLKEVLNTSLEIINSIRHEPTRSLVLELVENKEKVKEQQIIDFKNVRGGDYIIIVAPRQLQQRGQDVNVTWDDLVILWLVVYRMFY